MLYPLSYWSGFQLLLPASIAEAAWRWNSGRRLPRAQNLQLIPGGKAC